MSVVRNGTPSSGKDSLAVCDAVRAAVEGFAGNAQQADDMTLLAMHLRGFPERYVRTFPANDAVLQDASSFVEEKLSSMDCSDKARKEILVALDELLSNVVRCAKASGIAIELRFSRARHCLTMVISDDGKPFDPLRIPPPDISLPLEQRRHGGLGILIVRKTMDALSYQHAHGCNILTMRKSLS
jgi:anti-sigma regulatory factor (Ser/Thr protein kinase)